MVTNFVFCDVGNEVLYANLYERLNQFNVKSKNNTNI